MELNNISEYYKSCLHNKNVLGAAMSLVTTNNHKTFVFGYQDINKKNIVTEKTLFEIASLSKTFTAYAIMLLCEKGFIKLDDSVYQYIPYIYKNDNFYLKQVTVRQLLSHTAGFKFRYFHPRKTTNIFNLEKFLFNELFLKKSYIKKSNNPSFVYTGVDYLLLQYIIEQIVGTKFESFMEKDVFPQIGLNDSTYSINQPFMKYQYNESAAAGMCSSISDITVFLQANLKAYEHKVEDYHNSSKGVWLLMHKRISRVVPYGLGFCVSTLNQKRVIYHTGMNKGSFAIFLLLPDSHMGISILTNDIRGGEVVRELVYEILNEFVGSISVQDIESKFQLYKMGFFKRQIMNFSLNNLVL